MPARAGQPWRGAASIQLIEAAGDRRFWATLRELTDPLPPTEPGGDRADWDKSPGGIFTIRIEWSTAGTVTNGVAESIEVITYLPGTSTQVGTSWTISNPGASGSEERTFHFDDDPLTGVLGTNRCGMVEIYIRASRSSAIAWNADTKGVSAGLSVGTTHNWAAGYARARVTLASRVVSNVALGGSAPSLFAYPDSFFGRYNIDVTPYRSLTFELRHLNVSTQIRNQVSSSSTATQRDYSWTANTGVTAKILADYPNNGSVTERFVTQSLSFGGTPSQEYAWAASGHATGFARTSDNIVENTSSFTSDPRIETFDVTDPIINGVSTPVANAIVNFSKSTEPFHDISVTFKLRNARLETLTSAHSANDRNVTVHSRDVVADVNQRSLASGLAPDGAGLYSVPTFFFRGPSSAGSRGTGFDGDTASHDQTGRSKCLRVKVQGDGSANYPSASSGTFLKLSDLIRLDVHPQKTSTLVRDADPYVHPGSGENTSFTIGADAGHLFCYVGDVNGVSKADVNVGFQYYDPDAIKQNATDLFRTTASAGLDKGWTTVSAKHIVGAPAGSWRFRCWVDVDSTGSGGNYGDGATNPVDVTAKDQAVSFVSSYTADREMAIHVADVVPVGQEQTVRLEYRKRDGTRLVFDADPSIRIYKVNTNGTETVELALTTTTKLSGQDVWTVAWTPSAEGSFVIEARSDFSESGVIAVQRVSARKKWITTPGGALINRM